MSELDSITSRIIEGLPGDVRATADLGELIQELITELIQRLVSRCGEDGESISFMATEMEHGQRPLKWVTLRMLVRRKVGRRQRKKLGGNLLDAAIVRSAAGRSAQIQSVIDDLQ